MTPHYVIAFLFCATLLKVSAQRNSLYVITDVTTAPPLFLEEATTVQVRAQCSILCQQKEGCRYFQVCSDTGFLCKLYREDVGGAPISLPDGCKMFKRVSEKRCVVPTTSSTEISSETGNDVTESSDSPEVDTSEPIAAPSLPGSNPGNIGLNMTKFCADWSQEPCSSYFTDCRATTNMNSDVIVLTIKPNQYTLAMQVPCYDGRLIIQRRSQNCPHDFFNKSWTHYQDGFGDLRSDCFWLGLSKIRKLTFLDAYSFTISVWDDVSSSDFVSTSYSFLKLDREDNFFKLNLGSRTAGPEGFLDNNQLNGREFFTFDRDSNDACAGATGSGWWFNDECVMGNLNHLDGPLWRDLNLTLRTFDSSQMSLDRNYNPY